MRSMILASLLLAPSMVTSQMSMSMSMDMSMSMSMSYADGYNDYPFCTESFFDFVETGALNIGLDNTTAEVAKLVVELVCSCDIPADADTPQTFWDDLINGEQSQMCEDVLVELADTQNDFAVCNVTEGDLDALLANCPDLLYDLLPSDLYQYLPNAGEEITDCIASETLSGFVEDLCEEEDNMMSMSYSGSGSYSYMSTSYNSGSYSYNSGSMFYSYMISNSMTYSDQSCADLFVEVLETFVDEDTVDMILEAACGINLDDVVVDDLIPNLDDLPNVDDLINGDDDTPVPAPTTTTPSPTARPTAMPIPAPSPMPTLVPTEADTADVAVSMSMSATAAPTDDEKSLLKIKILNSTGFSESQIKNYQVVYTAARRKLLTGTWDVSFDVKATTATASTIASTATTTLNTASFKTSVTKSITTVTSVADATSVVSTRNPSSAPTMAPTQAPKKKKSKSDTGAASSTIIIIAVVCAAVVCIGGGVGYMQYQKSQNADFNEHFDNDEVNTFKGASQDGTRTSNPAVRDSAAKKHLDL